MMCLMALAIASCDKDGTGTSGDGNGGITPAGYVDLGLPSGTKWKATNETKSNDTCDFFTYDEAMEKFGTALPTRVQLEELENNCQWTWDDTIKAYKVVGPNSKSIFLPAAGYRYCNGFVYHVGFYGYYWSSTPIDSGYVWYLYFNAGEVNQYYYSRCYGLSVRLVHNP